MSLNELISDYFKSWLNIRINRLVCDGSVLLNQIPVEDNAEVNLLMRDPVDGSIKTRTVASLPGGGSGINIYNSDGITGSNRIVDSGGFSFTLQNAFTLVIDASFINLATAPIVDNAQTQILMRAASGQIYQRDASSLGGGPTIYSSDGTLAGNRIINADGNNLGIDLINQAVIEVADLQIFGATTIDIDTSSFKLINPVPNDNTLTRVLCQDPGTGEFKYRDAASIVAVTNQVCILSLGTAGATFSGSASLTYTRSGNMIGIQPDQVIRIDLAVATASIILNMSPTFTTTYGSLYYTTTTLASMPIQIRVAGGNWEMGILSISGTGGNTFTVNRFDGGLFPIGAPGVQIYRQSIMYIK